MHSWLQGCCSLRGSPGRAESRGCTAPSCPPATWPSPMELPGAGWLGQGMGVGDRGCLAGLYYNSGFLVAGRTLNYR